MTILRQSRERTIIAILHHYMAKKWRKKREWNMVPAIPFSVFRVPCVIS